MGGQLEPRATDFCALSAVSAPEVRLGSRAAARTGAEREEIDQRRRSSAAKSRRGAQLRRENAPETTRGHRGQDIDWRLLAVEVFQELI